jgi:hypothetical protein
VTGCIPPPGAPCGALAEGLGVALSEEIADDNEAFVALELQPLTTSAADSTAPEAAARCLSMVRFLLWIMGNLVMLVMITTKFKNHMNTMRIDHEKPQSHL